MTRSRHAEAYPERPLQQPRAWHQQAACKGQTHIFFPSDTAEGDQTNYKMIKRRTERAKEICFSCPVQRECFQEAMYSREFYGVWGGSTEKERETIRKRGIFDLKEAFRYVERPRSDIRSKSVHVS